MDREQGHATGGGLPTHCIPHATAACSQRQSHAPSWGSARTTPGGPSRTTHRPGSTPRHSRHRKGGFSQGENAPRGGFEQSCTGQKGRRPKLYVGRPPQSIWLPGSHLWLSSGSGSVSGSLVKLLPLNFHAALAIHCAERICKPGRMRFLPVELGIPECAALQSRSRMSPSSKVMNCP